MGDSSGSNCLVSRSRLGAWIEINAMYARGALDFCRSRLGAWIEMPGRGRNRRGYTVAPVWERGLKFLL